MQPVNTQYANDDLKAWQEYRASPSVVKREALLRRFESLIDLQVNKWAGPVNRDVLLNEARLMAARALDSYNPAAGTSLATHITNQLRPLSRLVYTYQNSVRMPEETARKIGTFNAASKRLQLTLGREPTTDELHNELGWTAREIHRINSAKHKNLLESGAPVSGDFFEGNFDDADDILLGGIYYELSPEEKQLFEGLTGYNGAQRLRPQALANKLHISVGSLNYKKIQLLRHIERLLQKHHILGR